MDDFAALAQRIAVAAEDVRGCLILSRDGLVLGAYPDGGEESLAKQAWLRFAALGEPERSFVEFPDQVWGFIRRGSYAAFAAADAGVRPGILLDQLEQALLTAEEARAKRDTLKVPDAPTAPSGRPRTSLHLGPPTGRPEHAPATAGPGAGAASAGRQGARLGPEPEPAKAPSQPGLDEAAHPTKATSEDRKPSDPDSSDAGGALKDSDAPPQDPASVSHLQREPQKLVSSHLDGQSEDPEEVDRVLLAKEFSGLLQPDQEDAEGS